MDSIQRGVMFHHGQLTVPPLGGPSVDVHAKGPIFEQLWWLQAATLGRIEQVETRWDNVVVGRLFYRPVKRYILRKVTLPPYTRVLGPILSGPRAGPTVESRNKIRIVRELYEQIGRYDSYHTVVRLDPDLLLAFQANRFDVSAKFTFVSSATVPMEIVRERMNNKIRNLVKSGNSICSIEFHYDFDRFRALSTIRSLPDHNDYVALTSIWCAVVAHGAGVIVSAVGEDGRDLAAVILVWDDERLYFLVSARDVSTEANKGYAVMFYESIAFAKRMNKDFDADGFASLSSARSLMKWGLPVSINFNIHKGGLFYSSAKPVKDRIRSSPL